MDLSAADRKSGQEAYQSVKSYQRNRRSTSSYIFILLFLSMPVTGAFIRRDFTMLAVWIFIIAVSAWQLYWQKLKNQKDLTYLAELKSKCGPDVYTELKKEPSTFAYKLLRKEYGPFGNRKEPILP